MARQVRPPAAAAAAANSAGAQFPRPGQSSTPNPEKLPFKAMAAKRLPVYLILISFPVVLVSSVVLYRRVFEGEEKRVQIGEHTPDGGLRIFTPEEKIERDKQTWLTRIFGSEKGS